MPFLDINTWTIEYEIAGTYSAPTYGYPGHLPTVDVLQVLNPLGEVEELDDEQLQEIKNEILELCC